MQPFTSTRCAGLVFLRWKHSLWMIARVMSRRRARSACAQFSFSRRHNSGASWRRWDFLSCLRLRLRWLILKILNSNFETESYGDPGSRAKNAREPGAHFGFLPTNRLVRLFLCGRLRIGTGLQFLEFLHFVLRLRSFPLFPVERGQSKMRLGG